MMKPLTLLILVGAFTAPLYGAEAVSAAVSSDAPAASASAPTASSAAVATAPVSAATPAPSEAAPVLLPADPVTPVASSGEGAAPLPQPVEPAAAVAPSAPSAPLAAGELQAVPLYRQDELLNWIEQGRHLTQVKQDRCQLTQDIEARASVMKIPAYQFLWGDMLAWGVCTKSNAELGVQYMWEAANQGLAPALEQLGRYYWKGTLVQKDLVRAETLMREAASLGFLRARIEWVEMLLQGMGSPLDYEDAYRWLHGSVIGDKALHQKAATLLNRLGNRMPANVVARAKAMH
ncbi:sel1 repeat family protein [Aeromonas veronii]